MDRIVFKSDISSTEISVEDLSKVGLKKPCLCVCKGNERIKVASFNDEDSAQMFMTELVNMVGVVDTESHKDTASLVEFADRLYEHFR